MDITALPQQAQIFLEIVQFNYMSRHFQRMVFDIANIMSNDSLSSNDKAHEFTALFEQYDEVDQAVFLRYVHKYSKFSNKRWTK